MSKSFAGAYLSVPDAAEKMGVSTLRIRQFIADGRLGAVKDNTGRWRVRLTPSAPETAGTYERQSINIVDLLLDEIIDLRHEEAMRTAEINRLKALVMRQNVVLEKAIARAQEQVALAGLQPLAGSAINLTQRAIRTAEDKQKRLERVEAELSKAMLRIDTRQSQRR